MVSRFECGSKDFSLPGRRVVIMLERVAKERGHPDMLVVDNGPELRGRELDRWAHDHGVKLFFIDPGKPMQNGSIERASTAACVRNASTGAGSPVSPKLDT